jgi:hypothetical protein
MKNILLLSTLLLTLVPLSAQAGCPPGDPSKLNYIRRDNNRCEGLQDHQEASGSLSLVSFITSNLTNLPSLLTIRVAGVTNPTLVVQEYSRNYRLDDVQMNPSGNSATFPLNTKILQNVGINVNSLSAAAYVIRNASPVYYPIILGKASSSYTFVLYAPNPTAFKKIQIRKVGSSIPYENQSLSQPIVGQISFPWDYGNAPAGDYELYLEDNRGKQQRFQFKHNPEWL